MRASNKRLSIPLKPSHFLVCTAYAGFRVFCGRALAGIASIPYSQKASVATRGEYGKHKFRIWVVFLLFCLLLELFSDVWIARVDGICSAYAANIPGIKLIIPHLVVALQPLIKVSTALDTLTVIGLLPKLVFWLFLPNT